MGSHGGATAEGQRRLIESYGVTEEYLGCPIRSSMETVVVCQTAEGFPVHFDRFAHGADHVVVLNRVKPHTKFVGDIESGLMKMLLIGLTLTTAYTLIVLMTMFWPAACRKSSATWTLLATMIGGRFVYGDV